MNKKIINAFIKNDPMGFISMDFPEEEYNIEWNDIIFDIKNSNKIKEAISEIVIKIFNQKFGEGTYLEYKDKIDLLSEDIFSSLVEDDPLTRP